MTITTYEEGVEQLFNLTLRLINGIDKQAAKLEEEQTPENAKLLTNIIKILPKLQYVLTQVQAMKKEIEAKAEAEYEYSTWELKSMQKYLNNILKDDEDTTEHTQEIN
jgi:hypothetical protein